MATDGRSKSERSKINDRSQQTIIASMSSNLKPARGKTHQAEESDDNRTKFYRGTKERRKRSPKKMEGTTRETHGS